MAILLALLSIVTQVFIPFVSKPLPTPTSTPIPTATWTPTATPTPTFTPLPTNTPRPTNTPAPTNTPEPTNTPTPSVTLQHEYAYIDSAGNTNVFGVVDNNSGQDITNVQIVITLSRADGSVYATGGTGIGVDVLQTGESIPFSWWFEANGAPWSTYKMSFSYSTGAPLYDYSHDFSFSNVAWSQDSNSMSLTGTITNNSDKTWGMVYIIFGGYDSQGNPVAYSGSQSYVTNLAPGQSAVFSGVSGKGTTVQSISLIAEGLYD